MSLPAEGYRAGDLWMLAAVLVWVIYTLLLRGPAYDLSASVTLSASISVALALMAPLVGFYAPDPLGAFSSFAVLMSVGYIALFASARGSPLVVRCCSAWPLGAGQFVQLMPVFGAALAVTLLGEALTSAEIIGATLVICGIMIVERTGANCAHVNRLRWRRVGRRGASLSERHQTSVR